MKISDYDQFVQATDQSSHLSVQERTEIAIYGLASEIGSVASAVKKRMLKEGKTTSEAPREDIKEEIGDVMWYCFALARAANEKKPINIFIHDILKLRAELAAGDDRSEKIRGVIGAENRQLFLEAAEAVRLSTREMMFNDYQSIAYLTARTEKKVLGEVCIAVLYQLSAELFRNLLPPIELELNRSIHDRPINDVLAEIAWHLAALATTYDLNFGEVAKYNIKKVSFRRNRTDAVIMHDESFPDGERFPRKFEVAFVSVGKDRAQMYFEGRRLGDPLTDNSYGDDGYRFHDVMHLANIAHLGWSPVVRGLMGRKRKSQPKVDEVEDGARAKIVEEAVIKAIHSEGQRLAGPTYSLTGDPVKLFANNDDISFRFLKFIHSLVGGLEVEKNRYWEWEDSIIQGYDVYHRLRQEGQGTVAVDLDARSLEYHPHVFIPLTGRVAGFGSARSSETPEETMPSDSKEALNRHRICAIKKAILASLGITPRGDSTLELIEVTERENGDISVRAAGAVQQAMWQKEVVCFKASILRMDRYWSCSMLALSDD